MERPSAADAAIAIRPDGLHVGRHAGWALASAYQPIYGLSGGRLILSGFEGLVRPFRDGAAQPAGALFESVAAGDHFFVESLSRALHLRNYPLARPAGLALFINVNPALYESVGVVERAFERMFAALGRHGPAPGNLVCEIIETEALDLPSLMRLCETFRAHGARVAVDDFGAGQSGMERYKALRPDVVKLDGPLFRDMSAHPLRRKLLHAMARTFRRDGTTILVEGIETQDQLDVALDLEASLFQGFGLGRPNLLPAVFPGEAMLQPMGLARRLG